MNPNDRKYSREHEWIKLDDSATGHATAGGFLITLTTDALLASSPGDAVADGNGVTLDVGSNVQIAVGVGDAVADGQARGGCHPA